MSSAIEVIRIKESLVQLQQAELGLLDCYAPWCQPCKAFAAVFRREAERQTAIETLPARTEAFVTGRLLDAAMRVRFAKLDVERYEDLAKGFRIRSLPTLLVWKKGELVHRSTGVLGAKELRALIERFRT